MALRLPSLRVAVLSKHISHPSNSAFSRVYSSRTATRSSRILRKGYLRGSSCTPRFPTNTQTQPDEKRLSWRASYSTTSDKPTTQRPQQPDDEMAEPTGLIANKGIELLTFGTPNGYKASILLEELKAAYGLEYSWQSINITKNTQKEPWFTAICPNGRIPAIVDHDRGGFAVFEGMAILSYLARLYDVDHRFSFRLDDDDYSVAEQWISWQHGGLGPMQGQANHFRFSRAKADASYPTQRYVGESERLYGVLDARLAQPRDYVAGPGRGRYSIADISLLGWVNIALFSGIDLKLFPNVQKWLDRCMERPAVRKGFAVPSVSALSNAKLSEAVENDDEARKKQEEHEAFVRESKEKFGYKYASP
ncbi:glutathione S-transferase II [Xylariales sp. AK1849]|nr:glutathione S-transferase II [Xylariales sp. AK1849]